MHFDDRSERPAGHVFVLPHQQVPSSDVKDRGYVLLNRCAPPASATLAYRSTKGTERDQFGAPAIGAGSVSGIQPARSPTPRKAWTPEIQSIVYPSRLVAWPSSNLMRSSETVASRIKSIRRTTATALGIGTGTHVAAGTGHRGKLLRLSDAGATVLPFRWGVVLTDAVYSAQQRWQVVVPVFRSARTPLPNDVRVEDPRDWISAINPSWREAVLACGLVCSVSHLDGQVDKIDSATLDDPTLDAIDAELTLRFAFAA